MHEIAMNLLTNLLNKAVMFVFFIGCVYTLRHAVLFAVNFKSGQKYTVKPKELSFLGGSIAIILTIIFSGIKLI